jgi:hypothetical protein
MDSYPSALHSQRSAQERDTFLYLALGAVSVALRLLECVSEGVDTDPPPGPSPDGVETDLPPRDLLR